MNQQIRVRQGSIDGRPAMVLDGLMPVPEATQLFQYLNNSPFSHTEFARHDTQAFRHWVCNFELDACRRMPLYRYTMDAIARHMPERGPHRCYRAYCNLCGYGDMLFTHTDSEPDVADLTALWYIAPRWDVEWGGETLLFNSDGDAEFVVSPRPGRLLLFDARIRHAGRPPNRVCVLPRLTFALKLEQEQKQETMQ